MNIKFDFVNDPAQKENICRTVLSDLPLWFGISEANEQYANGVRDKQFVAVSLDGKTIGFASIKENNKSTAELYLIGILANYHRAGIGAKLLNYISNVLKQQDFKLLQVKTLDETRESVEYKKTRCFYNKVGFIPLESFDELWGSDNPCLIMVKVL